MDIFTITIGMYKYNIKLNKNGNNYCKYPKESIPDFYGKIRTPSRVYYDYSTKDNKIIMYPPKLYFSVVHEDDVIENNLLYIRNEWPNWASIEVVSIE